jgi:hypothetical protein
MTILERRPSRATARLILMERSCKMGVLMPDGACEMGS